MEHFCIIANEEKDIGCQVAEKIKSYLESRGKSGRIVKNASEICGEQVDMGIVLGGDGTMIQAAKEVAPYDIPILGVNLGTLGFLTEVEKGNVMAALDDVLANHFTIQKRLTLQGHATICNEQKNMGIAINDFIVGKRGFGQMITTRVFVNDELVDTYVADGVLVATPTGSTAYNLSAGGPLLAPEMEGIIITPICPHSLNQRSIVVSADARIRIEVNTTRQGFDDRATFSVDGQLFATAKTGDVIHIEAAQYKIGIVKLEQAGFFERMRSKLTRN